MAEEFAYDKEYECEGCGENATDIGGDCYKCYKCGFEGCAAQE
jgi:hypothetical protein